MRLAVATADGVSLSQHFGRSKGFVIFDVEGKDYRRREFRANNHTPHAQGACGHEHGHQQGAHHHNSIVQLLSDCSYVLCGGMGGGAVEALRSNGIKPALVTGTRSVEEALTSYLEGSVNLIESGTCAGAPPFKEGHD